MANPPRVKGTRAESAAAKWLTDELGVTVTRGPLRGNADRGDLFGVPDWTIEVKNCKTPNLKQWGRELHAEQRNAGTRHGVVLWSPPGVGMTNVDKWIAFASEWYPQSRWVPPFGPANTLHKYVALMDGHDYAVRVDLGATWGTAMGASSWLVGVREWMAAA